MPAFRDEQIKNTALLDEYIIEIYHSLSNDIAKLNHNLQRLKNKEGKEAKKIEALIFLTDEARCLALSMSQVCKDIIVNPYIYTKSLRLRHLSPLPSLRDLEKDKEMVSHYEKLIQEHQLRVDAFKAEALLLDGENILPMAQSKPIKCDDDGLRALQDCSGMLSPSDLIQKGLNNQKIREKIEEFTLREKIIGCFKFLFGFICTLPTEIESEKLRFFNRYVVAQFPQEKSSIATSTTSIQSTS